jgi:hypothetical protein
MAVNYTKWSYNIQTFFILRPSEIYPNLDFWFENKPSGNPVWERSPIQGCQMACFRNQKSKFWVNFGGPCNGKSWHILWPFGLFYGHWKYLMDISYILWLFGIFSLFWYFVPRKIWQPCSDHERLKLVLAKVALKFLMLKKFRSPLAELMERSTFMRENEIRAHCVPGLQRPLLPFVWKHSAWSEARSDGC